MPYIKTLLLILCSATILAAQENPFHTQVMDAKNTIQKDFFDPEFDSLIWKAVARKTERTPVQTQTEAQQAITSMVNRLNRPTLRLMTKDQLQLFSKEISGEAHWGTGLIELLCIDIGARSKQPQVITLMEGTPAYRAGIKAGDIITGINGHNINGQDLTEVYELIRKPGEKEVRFTLLRNDQKLDITVPNEPIPAISNSVKATVKEVDQKRFAYIQLSIFIGNTSQQMKDFLEQLNKQPGIEGIILDLRNNPGGNVKSCLEIAGMFLGERSIARLKSNNGISDVKATVNQLTDLPVTVLVNKSTASAAEVLAGALQYHKRGIVVGEVTIGKGLAHKVVNLSDSQVMFMSTASFQHLNGKDILLNGITPDHLDSVLTLESAARFFN